MKLFVGPVIALIDEPIQITVTNLSPAAKLFITATMHFPWAPTEAYEASALFIADSNGTVDLSKQKPDEGTYDFIDSMGLIASMQKVSSKGANIALNISAEHPLVIEMYFECGEERDTVRLERMFKSPGVISQKIHDPFVGELFYTPCTNYKTIVVLGGSDGSLDSLSLIAGPLASRGFHVLNVGYFGLEGLPEKLEEIPLEYFEKIFAWLKDNPITQANEIYVHGTSKGGELALLLASRYEVIKKVAASAPHAYCFQALDGLMSGKNVSSWSYAGKSLPFIPVDNDIFFEHQRHCLDLHTPFGFTTTYRESMNRAANKEAARIKIENANADILLIAGQQDNVWNTYDGCLDVMEALAKHNYPYEYNLLAYPDLGHSLPVPYIIPLCETLSVQMPLGEFTSGGTLQGNCHAQADSWQKTVAFFQK
ncbi:acyl-CoA thioester hydrolase/BAAT C-terminal domain-containing protein [Brevibacillus formosus]|uniref:acyl-CoA thioester hydrolase/BAAT C-terminal domain-containing protein n=1 Tax=Brevibacillus formosus TaxID=54913 RepID=UPI003F1DEC73